MVNRFKLAQTLLYGLKGILKAQDMRMLIQLQYMIEQHTGVKMSPEEIENAVSKLESSASMVQFIETIHKDESA